MYAPTQIKSSGSEIGKGHATNVAKLVCAVCVQTTSRPRAECHCRRASAFKFDSASPPLILSLAFSSAKPYLCRSLVQGLACFATTAFLGNHRYVHTTGGFISPQSTTQLTPFQLDAGIFHRLPCQTSLGTCQHLVRPTSEPGAPFQCRRGP